MLLKLLLPVGAAVLGTAAVGQAADPRGRWITASGNLEVEIAPCGDALCGTVTKVLADNSMSRAGQPMVPADARPALGMKILIDLVPDEGDTPPATWRGRIYDRENAKTYSATVEVDDKPDARGELRVRGYVGLPIFGRTQRWQRAPGG